MDEDEDRKTREHNRIQQEQELRRILKKTARKMFWLMMILMAQFVVLVLWMLCAFLGWTK